MWPRAYRTGNQGGDPGSIERKANVPWRRRSICLRQMQNGRSRLTRKDIVPDPSVPSKPSLTFRTRKTLLSTLSESVLLSEQLSGIETNVRLILEYALEGGNERDHVAFPCVFGAIAGVGEIWASGDERVIAVASQASRPVSVDDSEGGWVGRVRWCLQNTEEAWVSSKPQEGRAAILGIVEEMDGPFCVCSS